MLRDTNYLTILPFMVNDLGLSGSSLIIYAVIYSFSQDEKSKFSGSITYISEWAGIDQRNVQYNLKLLSAPDKNLIIIEKRPGYTNRYRVNPEKIPERFRAIPPGTPDKTSYPPLINDPGTPDKTSYDIDLNIDLRNNDLKKDPAKTKEDAVIVFNRFREMCNELKLFPECRDLIIPPAEYDCLPTFQHYSWDELVNSAKNFDWHKSGRCSKDGSRWKPPPPYGSIYGFLKKGVARYFDDDALDSQFREG
jgi:hypothetical protein